MKRHGVLMASEDSTHVESAMISTSAGDFEYTREVRLRQLVRGRSCAVVVLIIIEDMQSIPSMCSEPISHQESG